MSRHLDASVIEPLASWSEVQRSIVDGHTLPSPSLDDTLLRRGDDVVLSRVALVDGLGSLVKTATVFPGNASRGHPTVNGSVTLFSDETGVLDATLDFHLVTKWKTAGDSLLAASLLAPPRVSEILIVGSGTVAASMIDAYRSEWPAARYTVWSRTSANAAALADRLGAHAVEDLERAVGRADIISTSTMAPDPLIHGAWLRPGQHLDLIGGYRADMRESDDECVVRSRVFVDCHRTAADVGDIADPIASGIIDGAIADYRDLSTGRFARTAPDEITMFKNAGGAHLDLMVARHFAQLVTT